MGAQSPRGKFRESEVRAGTVPLVHLAEDVNLL
jgi:hypothetical protein